MTGRLMMLGLYPSSSVKQLKDSHAKERALLCREIERLKLEVYTMRRAIIEEPTSAPRLKAFCKRRWDELVRTQEIHQKCVEAYSVARDALGVALRDKSIADKWVVERSKVLALLNERQIGHASMGNFYHEDNLLERITDFVNEFDTINDQLASANGQLRVYNQAPIAS